MADTTENPVCPDFINGCKGTLRPADDRVAAIQRELADCEQLQADYRRLSTELQTLAGDNRRYAMRYRHRVNALERQKAVIAMRIAGAAGLRAELSKLSGVKQ